MSKLTKLVRDPRRFLLDSKAYVRWNRMRNRRGATVDIGEFPLRNDLDADLGDVLLENIAQHVPVVDASDRGQLALAVRRADLGTLTMFLHELGRQKKMTIKIKTRERDLDLRRATLLEIDDAARRGTFFDATFSVAKGRAADVCFEVWEDDGTQYIGPRDNRDARRVSKETVEEYGLFRIGEFKTLASLHSESAPHDVTFPIDAVYTWVNDGDPQWRAMWSQTFGKPLRDNDGEDQSLVRFQNRDELRYSLRSLERFAPWIRNVYVVSNCEPPPWADLENPRLTWVRHDEIFPAAALPTFSSHAIESRLHKIPGLAPHFLYINDDVFFLRPAEPGDFFCRSGYAKAFLEEYGSVSGSVSEADPAYLNAARNGKRLLEQTFGCSVRALHKHTVFALRKDVLEDIEKQFATEVDATTHRNLRTKEDLSVASFLHHHYGYLTERVIPYPSDAILVKPSSPNYERTLVQILEGRKVPLTACLNDGSGDLSLQERWDQHVVGFMKRYFPSRSSFEKR